MYQDNPYRTPGDARPGQYDWTLARRIIRALLLIAVAFLVIDTCIYVRYHKLSRTTQGQADAMREWNWFTDFRADDAKRAIEDALGS
jgi:hypothetical protein